MVLQPTAEELIVKLCQELDWALNLIINLDPDILSIERARAGLAVTEILRRRIQTN